MCPLAYSPSLPSPEPHTSSTALAAPARLSCGEAGDGERNASSPARARGDGVSPSEWSFDASSPDAAHEGRFRRPPGAVLQHHRPRRGDRRQGTCRGDREGRGRHRRRPEGGGAGAPQGIRDARPRRRAEPR
jgi:hypothetical protein